MKNQKNNTATSGSGKDGNDPYKNDPTRQDERDNDATRIRPEKGNREKPAVPPEPGGKNPGSGEVEEPVRPAPYKRTPTHKPEPVVEPGKQEGSGINKGYNPAAPENKNNEEQERSDSGDPVMKKYGRGL